METIDIIRNFCNQKGIKISRLEKELSFGNGSLAKSRNIAFERMIKIADYFDVSLDRFRGDDSDHDKNMVKTDLSDEAYAIGKAYDNAADYKKSAVADLLGVKREDSIRTDTAASA